MVRGVIFPFTRGGVVAAILLGMGRAVGEAIAVTQVIGGFTGIPTSLFQPGDTLASRIAAQYQGAASNLHVASIVYLALILLVFSLLTNLGAQVIVNRFELRRRAALMAAQAQPQPSLLSAGGRVRRRKRVNRAVEASWLLASALAVGVLGIVTVSVFLRGLQALNSISSRRRRRHSARAGGGIAHAFVGSLVLVGLGAAMALPFGVLICDLRQRVRRPPARPGDQALARRPQRPAVDRDRDLPLRPARRRARAERLHRLACARRSSCCR